MKQWNKNDTINEERGMNNNMSKGMSLPNLNNPDNEGPDIKKLLKKSEDKLNFGNASDNDFLRIYMRINQDWVSSQNPINITIIIIIIIIIISFLKEKEEIN